MVGIFSTDSPCMRIGRTSKTAIIRLGPGEKIILEINWKLDRVLYLAYGVWGLEKVFWFIFECFEFILGFDFL